CGIAAIYHFPNAEPSRLAPPAGPEQVSRLMPRMLLDLQNRGQLAAGFTTYNPERQRLLDTYKQIGTVVEAFRLNHHDKYDIIMHYLSRELRGDERPDLVEVFRNLSRKFDGAYNLVFLNAMGDLAIVRDPKGFRPLCYAQDGPLFAAASESVPLLNLGFRDIRSLETCDMLAIVHNPIRCHRQAHKAQ